MTQTYSQAAVGQSSGLKQALTWLSWVVVVCGVIGVFVIPWFHPLKTPTQGDSYIYGFDNALAWKVVALTLVLLTLLRIVMAFVSPAGAIRVLSICQLQRLPAVVGI